MAPRSLTGTTIAITGAGRGIGAATARALAARGARVVIGDLDGESAARVAASIGTAASGIALDVSDRASFAAFVAAAGRIDVLVNNAGIMPLGPLTDESAEAEDRILGVNLRGVITGTKLVVPGMIAAGGGHIVNIASAVGRVAIAHGATYSASKYAVIGFSEAARSELAPHHIDVSCVLPTVVATDLAAGVAATKGMSRVSPEQVASAIVSVIERPRFETWVPSYGHALWAGSQLLPRGLQDRVIHAMGADTVLSRADHAARAQYEKEAAGTRATEKAPSEASTAVVASGVT